ncbi:hypothetical protein [Priestia megaterium]|uniref:hypothetical protein n=1 Tax=Priestia megaterium TaxID=1404 RepID=UPI0039FDBDEC
MANNNLFNKYEMVNQKFSAIYDHASERAKEIVSIGTDKDITKLVSNYQRLINKYDQSKNPTVYSEEEHVELMICTREIAKRLNLTKYGIDWRSFNSPIEAFALSALSLIWSLKLVLVNYKIGKFEVDLVVVDYFGNKVLLIDLQGKKPHENRQAMDQIKKKYYESYGYPFVQIQGTDFKNNFMNYVDLFTQEIEKSLSDVNVNYLYSKNKMKRRQKL